MSKTISLRSTTIDLPMLTSSHSPARKTKLGFTVGPACDDEEVRGWGGQAPGGQPPDTEIPYPYPACAVVLLLTCMLPTGRSVWVSADLQKLPCSSVTALSKACARGGSPMPPA